MGTASFLFIFWKSIYQACMIFVLGCLLFETSFFKVTTITFSALVFTELLNIFTLVDRLNPWIIGANVLSLLSYIVSVVFFRDFLGMVPVDLDLLIKITIITGVCWLPFELFKQLKRCMCPTISDKIMANAKHRKPKRDKDRTESQSLILNLPENEA